MKFKEIRYTHLVYEEIETKMKSLIESFRNSISIDEAIENYKAFDECIDSFSTNFNLAYIRNSLDTTDEYYSKEILYMYEIHPRVQNVYKDMILALLETSFRDELEKRWNSLMFINEEIELKTISPEIAEDLQEENKLMNKYVNLMASAKIKFNGEELNLSKLGAYLENPDREIREQVLKAKADWLDLNTDQMDIIFDKLVSLRDTIAKKLGLKDFIELGYYRWRRNCYNSEMVTEFREGVLKYIVPVVIKFKEKQAKRLGVPSIKVFDLAINYLDGNAKPKGSEKDLLKKAKKMYEELDKDTGEFFNMMLENELIDVTSRPGKAVGGYCINLEEYKVPFIFANFNGTSADIDVLTHEAGHAFAFYMNRNVKPSILKQFTFDVAEIHSMSMEFLTWDWMELFFEDETPKYLETHLENALTSLPYMCMVDEFQHIIYEKPQMNIEERNIVWLELEKKYRPWLHFTGAPSFYAEGRRWQEQTHIYKLPFYYIDYALAGVVALYFWAEAQENHAKAWAKYKKLVSFAGTKTFVELLEECELPNPFKAENLKIIADTVNKWLLEK